MILCPRLKSFKQEQGRGQDKQRSNKLCGQQKPRPVKDLATQWARLQRKTWSCTLGMIIPAACKYMWYVGQRITVRHSAVFALALTSCFLVEKGKSSEQASYHDSRWLLNLNGELLFSLASHSPGSTLHPRWNCKSPAYLVCLTSLDLKTQSLQLHTFLRLGIWSPYQRPQPSKGPSQQNKKECACMHTHKPWSLFSPLYFNVTD